MYVYRACMRSFMSQNLIEFCMFWLNFEKPRDGEEENLAAGSNFPLKECLPGTACTHPPGAIGILIFNISFGLIFIVGCVWPGCVLD